MLLSQDVRWEVGMDFQRYAGSLRSRLHAGAVRPAAVAGVAALLAVALGAAGLRLAGAMEAPAFQVERADAGQDAVDEVPEQQAAQVAVYVSGQVASPGLYYLDEGARVADAIELAGGFSEDAAEGELNLARLLADGEQVDVPSRSELAAAMAQPTGQGAGSGRSGAGLVNINTADAAALQTLDGIGAATAAKIVADREANGPFKTVDDLTRVSGIGDKKLAAIKGAICV